MEKFEWFMTHLPNVHIEARKYLDEKCGGTTRLSKNDPRINDVIFQSAYKALAHAGILWASEQLRKGNKIDSSVDGFVYMVDITHIVHLKTEINTLMKNNHMFPINLYCDDQKIYIMYVFIADCNELGVEFKFGDPKRGLIRRQYSNVNEFMFMHVDQEHVDIILQGCKYSGPMNVDVIEFIRRVCNQLRKALHGAKIDWDFEVTIPVEASIELKRLMHEYFIKHQCYPYYTEKDVLGRINHVYKYPISDSAYAEYMIRCISNKYL